eukprot:5834583-Prymnesium_polylepis.1
MLPPASRVRPTVAPRVSSTRDPHAHNFFVPRTMGAYSCVHCNRLVPTPRHFTGVTLRPMRCDNVQ